MDRRTLERLTREFHSVEKDTVIQLLTSYSGPESDRVRWDILELSKGDVEKVREFVQAAQRDYRDVLYWAEYYKDDPMVRDRDAKQMVGEILAEWGRKKD